MSNKEIIGKTESGENIYSNPSPTANKHLAVLGKSGAGKTTYILKRIIQLVLLGYSVVVINWRKNLDHSLMDELIRREYEKHVKVIDVIEEGIKLPLFDPIVDNHGKKEKEINICNRISSILKAATDLTPSQAREVYSALVEVKTRNMFSKNGMHAITDYLDRMKRATALSAANKLGPLCNTNIIRDGDFWDDIPMIYEIDLNGLEYDDQIVVAKFLLDYLARMANRGLFMKNGLAIFVDECHNLDFGKGSTIYTLINESRKLNLRLMLATTELKTTGKNDMSVVLQCGECAFFEPQASQRKLFADLIDTEGPDKWLYRLSNLQTGQFVFAGNYVTEYGDEICNTPVILNFALDDCEDDVATDSAESVNNESKEEIA